MDHGAFGALIKELARLPGLGPRSARRIALHVLTDQPGQARMLAAALETAAATLKTCTQCGNLDDHDPCRICTDPARDKTSLCVVSGVADVWAIERTRGFHGCYHVLGGILSALDGVTPDMLRIDDLAVRLRDLPQILEVVLALPATVDGQTTTHYLHDMLQTRLAGDRPMPRVTRLSLGLPMGGELDYLDDGTITMALRARAAI
jgi:recombination protein RecR